MAEQFSKETVDLIAKQSAESGYHSGYTAGYEQCKKDMITLLKKEAGKVLVEDWDGGGACPRFGGNYEDFDQEFWKKQEDSTAEGANQ